MPTDSPELLEVILDSWRRNNQVLINLLRLLPEGGLEARAMPSSPSVGQMFAHMHHERMVSVAENAPEHAGETPAEEWAALADREQIAAQLEESARRVADAVRGRCERGEPFDLDYDHPILLIQLLIFHEAYHHGQIKLALKAGGLAIPDSVAGPLTWKVWRQRRG
ncbi:MAG: damage-inducible protein DinB [Acidobacteria bacterium]|nr:MAG: damage-inducible protein DinB [Acidobacteriota bacterium]REK03572.1 MAG: damage-inducible protein DinB [Acidobacteriota bacterium]